MGRKCKNDGKMEDFCDFIVIFTIYHMKQKKE